jgi:hypothetical protein
MYSGLMNSWTLLASPVLKDLIAHLTVLIFSRQHGFILINRLGDIRVRERVKSILPALDFLNI